MANNGLTRRDFLKNTGIMAGSLSLAKLSPKDAYAQGGAGFTPAPPLYPYRSWEDIYKKKWTWDKIVRGTHHVNCWYQASCCFDIYVKDGIVMREEQAAVYPQVDPKTPDFNPRGCQKGACYSERMYDPTRIKYPLKRIGKRGEGKWKRVSWDEALTEIADTMIDVLQKEGSDAIIWEIATQFSLGNQGVGLNRLTYFLDMPILDMNPEIGDGHHGSAVTFGKVMNEGSGDDWFYSDLFFIWGANPLYTNIPNSHFFLEARYNGTRIVSITPDYNPSSIHADLWIPINVGTDTALALSLAYVIINEKLFNESFLCEQTDLPLVVRDDTKRFLREKDIKEGGKDDIFYFFDLTDENIKEAPKTTLRLDGLMPSLEGEYEVETLQGKVKVRPAFEILKNKLQDYTPEKTHQITGIKPEITRRLALDIAKAKSACNITQSNFSKFYHGSLAERAQILVFALAGHFGKKGGGFRSFPFLYADALEPFVSLRRPGVEGLQELEKEVEPLVKKLKEEGYTEEMIIYRIGKENIH